MPNRLSAANSPYLLQHADNPVDWYEWGDEAFEVARRRDVPVFLSVGYSSCHWCHVMAHESFEDDTTAAYLDDHFVSIKVDREERPDIDAVYMTATQALTGRGGWPMSVWLDHQRRPFYAGTYFPARPHHGSPSFRQVLVALHDAWVERRDELEESASSITSSLQAATDRLAGPGTGTTTPGASDDALEAALDAAVETVVERAWDRERGGFGRAPKFPQAMLVQFLLDHHVVTGDATARDAAVAALEAMARGGIHDHLAGGFARYSTDAHWLLPHFEKMLYDNGLLLECYADAAVLTGRADLADAATGIATWLLDEMRDPGGGFIAALDADTDGEEGATAVWSDAEFREVVAGVGVDPGLAAAWFGVRPEGNFRPERGEPAGDNILHTSTTVEAFADDHDLEVDTVTDLLHRAVAALHDRRTTRPQPGRDDKVIVAWNALAIRGLARAGSVLARPDWIAAATGAADFVLDRMVDDDGRLLHVHRDGRSAVPAFLDDVAGLALALVELAPAAGRPDLVARARELADQATARFATDDGGFATTADDAEDLVVRPRDVHDNAQPAGPSLLAAAQARLGLVTGDHDRTDLARALVGRHLDQLGRVPTAHGELLRVARFLAADQREVAIVGPVSGARDALVRQVLGRPRPGTVTVVAEAGADPGLALLEGRVPRDGVPTAWVCRGFVCDLPVTDPASMAASLSA